MDVREFAEELLRALASTELFGRVALQTEGPIAQGYAYTQGTRYLRFYFNEMTGTIAFALIDGQQRMWGIDYDNRRGWHLHPADAPTEHIEIAMVSVADIIARLLQDVASDDAAPLSGQ